MHVEQWKFKRKEEDGLSVKPGKLQYKWALAGSRKVGVFLSD